MSEQVIEDGDILEFPNGDQYRAKIYGKDHLFISLDGKMPIGPVVGQKRVFMYYIDGRGAKIIKGGNKNEV